MSNQNAPSFTITHAATQLGDCSKSLAGESSSSCDNDSKSIAHAYEDTSRSDKSFSEHPSSETSFLPIETSHGDDIVELDGQSYASYDDVIADLVGLEISSLDQLHLPQTIEHGHFGLDGTNDNASKATKEEKKAAEKAKKAKQAARTSQQQAFMASFFNRAGQSTTAVATTSTVAPTTTNESQPDINATDDQQSTEQELGDSRIPGDDLQSTRGFQDVIPDSQEEYDDLSKVVSPQPSNTNRRFDEIEEIADSQQSQSSPIQDHQNAESDSMTGIIQTGESTEPDLAVKHGLQETKSRTLLPASDSMSSIGSSAAGIEAEVRTPAQKTAFDAMMTTGTSSRAQGSASGDSHLPDVARPAKAARTGVVAPKESKRKAMSKRQLSSIGVNHRLAELDVDLASQLTGPLCKIPKSQDELLQKNMDNIVRFHDADLTALPGFDDEASWSKCYYIDDVKALPRQPERDWICQRPNLGDWTPNPRSSNKFRKCWTFTFINKAIPDLKFHDLAAMTAEQRQEAEEKQRLKKLELRSVNNIRPYALSNVAAAQQLGDLAADYMNRWPAPKLPRDEVLSRKFGFWNYFFYKIFWDLFPSHKPSRADGEDKVLPFKRYNFTDDKHSDDEPGPMYGLYDRFHKAKKNWCVVARAFSFSIDGTPLDKDHAFRTPYITPAHRDVPEPNDVPDMWYDMWIPDDIPADIPAEDHDLFRKAQKLMHALMYRVAGTIGTPDALHAMFDEHRADLMDHKNPNRQYRHRRGPWQGRRVLIPTFKSYRWILLRSRNTDGVWWPSIHVNSTSKTDAAFVMEATMHHFMKTPGLAKAMTFGALIADLFNNGRVEKAVMRNSVMDCRTDKTIHPATPHTCQWCLECADCSDMVHVEAVTGTYRVCRRCATTNDIPPDDISQTHLFNMKRQVNGNVHMDRKRAEHTDYPLTMADVTSTTKQVVEHLGKNVSSDGLEISDDYCPGMTRSMVVVPEYGSTARRRRHPFQPSVDAVDSIYLLEDRLRLHVVDNIACTALYINLLKYSWPVALLQVIADHQRLRVQADPPDQASLEQIYNRLDHIYIITLQTPWRLKDRLSRGYKARLATLRKQWRTGLADRNVRLSTMWDAGIKSHFDTATFWRNNTDDDHMLSRYIPQTEVVLAEMEQHFGRKIPRSNSGAPWLWISNHQPENWTWANVLRLFGSRLDRMDNWCDKEHEHFEESAITLLIEYVQQWFQNDGKDKFLGLEQTIYQLHPGRFVAAHLHHRERMRTGCKVPFPTSYYKDYDSSLSNISFETAMSNWCKSDFDEETYPAILADIATIHLSDRLLQRSTEPVTQIKQLELLHQRGSLTQDSVLEVDEEDELSENEVLEGEFPEQGSASSD